MSFIKESPRGVVVKVFVQPRSSRNSIEGIHGDALKIRLKAPPVDGAANKMCISFLAKCIGVSKSTVEVLSGHASRTKRILFHYTDDNASTAQRARYKRQIESRLITEENS
jgi:uncharacterized protein (TIGR00251 family)